MLVMLVMYLFLGTHVNVLSQRLVQYIMIGREMYVIFYTSVHEVMVVTHTICSCRQPCVREPLSYYRFVYHFNFLQLFLLASGQTVEILSVVQVFYVTAHENGTSRKKCWCRGLVTCVGIQYLHTGIILGRPVVELDMGGTVST